MSSSAAAHTAAVFVKSHIANPVETVFNGPVVAAQSKHTFRICVFGFQTGDTINRFGTEFLGHDFCGLAMDSKDLGGVRKIQIIVEFSTGPDLADFQTAVSFIGCGVLRGEKTPVSDRRYLDGGWADCLAMNR